MTKIFFYIILLILTAICVYNIISNDESFSVNCDKEVSKSGCKASNERECHSYWKKGDGNKRYRCTWSGKKCKFLKRDEYLCIDEDDRRRREREEAEQAAQNQLDALFRANRESQKENDNLSVINTELERRLQLARQKVKMDLESANREKDIAEKERADLDAHLKKLKSDWAKKQKASQDKNISLKESLRLKEEEAKQLQLALNAEIQKFENERKLREAIRLELLSTQTENDRIRKNNSLALSQQTAQENRQREELRKRLEAKAEVERLEKEKARIEKEKQEKELLKKKLEYAANIQRKEYEAKLFAERRKLEKAETQRKALLEAEKLARSETERLALKAANDKLLTRINGLKKEIAKMIEIAAKERVEMQLEIDGLKLELSLLEKMLKKIQDKLAWTENELYTCSIYTRRMQVVNPYLI